jgi:hypothetical protein
VLILIAAKQENQGWTAIIEGPMGRLLLKDLVWITDRQDLLEINYWLAWGVLQGMYHCCFSLPGKVALLPPQ